jgi:hypothetical protein
MTVGEFILAFILLITALFLVMYAVSIYQNQISMRNQANSVPVPYTTTESKSPSTQYIAVPYPVCQSSS